MRLKKLVLSFSRDSIKLHAALFHSLSPTPALVRHLSSFFIFTFYPRPYFQASNGNDPWSVWNADPSGGASNNWASNPEGTQTGKTAAGDPWGSTQGHPQAYQGPGKTRRVLASTPAGYLKSMCKYIRLSADDLLLLHTNTIVSNYCWCFCLYFLVFLTETQI